LRSTYQVDKTPELFHFSESFKKIFCFYSVWASLRRKMHFKLPVTLPKTIKPAQEFFCAGEFHIHR